MKELNKLNDAALLKKKNTAQITTYILMGLFIISLITSIYNYLQHGYPHTTVMPLLIVAILLPNVGTLRSIKKEVGLRNLE